MSVIPPNLNETYRNLTGFKKNLVRFYADRSGVINSNDVLRFSMPKEILDMRSLLHYFEFSSTAAASGTTNSFAGSDSAGSGRRGLNSGSESM